MIRLQILKLVDQVSVIHPIVSNVEIGEVGEFCLEHFEKGLLEKNRTFLRSVDTREQENRILSLRFIHQRRNLNELQSNQIRGPEG